MEDSDEEVFEDALEAQPIPTDLNLCESLDEAKKAVHLFLNNEFLEARDLLKPLVGKSMYHTVGNAVFDFLEAVLTFEPQYIEKAAESLKTSLSLCNYYRKKLSFQESLGKMVKRANYDNITPEEMHAELCYAESLLLKSLLSFIEDETLVSFIKAGLKIRTCFNSYKLCHSILKGRHWKDDEVHKVHFESGVRVGIGAFNLMVSHLPSRIIKLLEFMGFSGSKERGLSELEAGYRLHLGIRQVLCAMSLLTYNLIVVYMLSYRDGNLRLCEEILHDQLKLYPQGAWFLYYKGRLEFMKGQISEANEWFTRSWKSQNVWPQFHHMCYWELMWTHIIQQDWVQASNFAGLLLDESKWSKTIYGYHKVATSLMMTGLNKDQLEDVQYLIQHIPTWRQKIAGKSLPIEKFCVRRCERYTAQNNFLMLPAIELLYLWNYFKILAKNWDLCHSVYKLILQTLREFDKLQLSETEYEHDNRALLLLLQGSCLYYMGSPMQAEQCLKQVVTNEKKIKQDTFLLPFALVELAIVYHSQGNTTKAIQLLEDVKKNYTGYSLESRLHFRIHAALLEFTKK